MTATNHVIAGALIGATLNNPFAAVLVAVGSHFIFDSLPHFGGFAQTSRAFKVALMADMSLAFSMLILMYALLYPGSEIVILAAVAAASPDLMWMPGWLGELRGKPSASSGKIASFHKRIQWAESRGGWVYELLFFVSGVYLLVITN